MNTELNLNTKFTTTARFLGCSMSSMRRNGLRMEISKTALMNLVKLKRRVCGLSYGSDCTERPSLVTYTSLFERKNNMECNLKSLRA